MNSKTRLFFLLLVVTLLATGCGSGTVLAPTPTQTATLTPTLTPTSTLTPIPSFTPTLPPLRGPKVGHWIGKIWTILSVSFDVGSDGEIHNWTITFGGPPSCFSALEEDIVIQPDGTFIVGGLKEDGFLLENSAKGQFDSPTTVTGTSSSVVRCGEIAMASLDKNHQPQEEDWHAEWQMP